MERRKGFRGPVATIKKEDIEAYAEAIHREIAELDEPIHIPARPTDEKIKTPLEKFQIYKGVISDMDTKGVAAVLVGRIKGTIAVADRSWIGRTPKMGDVYWVRLKTGTEDQFVIEQELRLESALYSYSPLTGELKAMIGGFSFKKSERKGAIQKQ